MGFVLWGDHWNPTGELVARLYGTTGRLLRTIDRSALSGEALRAVWTTADDEALCFVTESRRLLVLSASGDLGHGSPTLFNDRVVHGVPREVIEIGAVLSRTHPRELAEIVSTTLRGENPRPGVDCAVALVGTWLGDVDARRLLESRLLGGEVPREVLPELLRELPGALAQDSARAILLGHLAAEEERVWRAAGEGMLAMPSGASALLNFAESQSGIQRLRAIAVLESPRAVSPEAVQRLSEIARSSDLEMARIAIRAIASQDSAERRRLLAQLLESGSADDQWIATYFQRTPTREAVPALIKALRRHADSDELLAETLVDGLRYATGWDLGAAPDLWAERWRSQGR
jgi:hypothetical protein